jgi:hypothetical protein
MVKVSIDNEKVPLAIRYPVVYRFGTHPTPEVKLALT